MQDHKSSKIAEICLTDATLRRLPSEISDFLNSPKIHLLYLPTLGKLMSYPPSDPSAAHRLHRCTEFLNSKGEHTGRKRKNQKTRIALPLQKLPKTGTNLSMFFPCPEGENQPRADQQIAARFRKVGQKGGCPYFWYFLALFEVF